MTESVNPKDRAAAREHRARLDLLEPAAEEMIAAAMENGAITKDYGIRNYVEEGNEISYRGYLAAMKRHINRLLMGEDYAPDSLVHHLGHIGANVEILAAAMEAGTLIDDRAPYKVQPPVCSACGQRHQPDEPCYDPPEPDLPADFAGSKLDLPVVTDELNPGTPLWQRPGMGYSDGPPPPQFQTGGDFVPYKGIADN